MGQNMLNRVLGIFMGKINEIIAAQQQATEKYRQTPNKTDQPSPFQNNINNNPNILQNHGNHIPRLGNNVPYADSRNQAKSGTYSTPM